MLSLKTFMPSLVGVLALSIVGTATPVAEPKVDALQLKRDSTCVGGTYNTCVEFYFETICLTTCDGDNEIEVMDCRTQCSTREQEACETYCS